MKSLQKFLFERRGDIMSDDAVYYEISMHKYKRPQVNELSLEKVQKYTDKLGMTQFDDNRIK